MRLERFYPVEAGISCRLIRFLFVCFLRGVIYKTNLNFQIMEKSRKRNLSYFPKPLFSPEVTTVDTLLWAFPETSHVNRSIFVLFLLHK